MPAPSKADRPVATPASPAAAVAIIGGGYTGAAAAIHLSRLSSVPLDITIIEPRVAVGGGLAYSNAGPDHRINGTHELLIVFPDDLGHFPRWYARNENDPEAVWTDGMTYPRRTAFGRYMAELVDAHAARNASGSRIGHVRDRAVAIARTGAGYRLTLASGAVREADFVLYTAAASAPGWPSGLPASVADHPAYVADPLADPALPGIDRAAPVLLIGTGLTAADVIATLLRRGHTGPITAISRRGLRPLPQGRFGDIAALLARVQRPVPRFVERHGELDRLLDIFTALRRDIAVAQAEGRDWKEAFDDVRDAAPRLWPALSVADRRRFLRHLKSWYDVHRYRMVPHVGAMIDAAEAEGKVHFRAARIVAAAPVGHRVHVDIRRRGSAVVERGDYGAVVNCTGPRSVPDRAADPFLDRLFEAGLARPDPVGLGLDVDDDCRLLNANGEPSARLWAFGLSTRGRFGDVTAVPQITIQLVRTLPRLCGAIAREHERRMP